MGSPIPLQTKVPEADVRISPNQKSLLMAGTLPSFPLLAVPDAPSKSDLALQGLDQALLDAEIVDPTTSCSLSSEEGNDTMGLSEKMRKRLRDLAIIELFAGMFF
jgi:ATP-dependent RNA helicase DDX51/DBP6